MQEITKAILKVMSEVKSIDKTLSVGTGQSQYKGVADKDVKQIIGDAMEKNGLVILPISVEPKTTVSEWDQTDQYGTKHKMSVLTEVVTKYRLMHTSGESIELSGYGHGVDSQDKSAGKATTYALKNTLLYSFLVPTGAIDDTDNTHSDDLPVRQTKPVQQPQTNTRKCSFHGEDMTYAVSKKSGKGYYAHKVNGEFCFGKGTKAEQSQDQEYSSDQVADDAYEALNN